jgi:hypothetical protein
MTLWNMIAGEIGYRKLSFVLGCLSVAIAVGAVAGSDALLRGHDRRTEQLVEQKEARTREEMVRMEDDYRVIMKRMGYNTLILHRDQDLGELHAQGYPTVTMPEAYVERLVAGGIETLNHLLPVLQKRIQWPETGEMILLTGVRGQVPIAGMKADRAPIMAPIPTGRVALGRALAKRADKTAGETLTLMGESFVVERVEAARGTADDLAVWVDLTKAQKWLNEPGRINGILALECVCRADSLGLITAEVTKLLPETQVLEFTSKVRGRAETRQRAAETRLAAITAEKEQRLRLRGERERLAAVLTPLTVAGAALWIVLLAYGNARTRRSEIGMLRAVGVRQHQILLLFMSKAALTGAAGSLVGIAAGVAAGAWAAGIRMGDGAAWELAGGWRLGWLFLLGLALSCGAVLGPAILAARRDPAEVMGEE